MWEEKGRGDEVSFRGTTERDNGLTINAIRRPRHGKTGKGPPGEDVKYAVGRNY